jgi:hypothetical protein
MAFMAVASRLVQTPSSSRARDGRYDRIRAVREDDVLGGVAYAVDLDDARAGEPTDAPQQVDALVGQPPLLAGVGIVRDHEIAPGERRLDVDLRARCGLTRLMHRLTRAEQRLGRDARPVRTLAADQLALDERDAQAALGQRTGAVLARRAAAQDDDVVVRECPAGRDIGAHRRSFSTLVVRVSASRARRAVAPV